MNLIYDEYECCWVWVDSKDSGNELSPRFDDESGAMDWHRTLKRIFTGK